MKQWLVAIALCVGAGVLSAKEDRPAVKDVGSDRAIAGGSFSQAHPVAGDLMAAGGTVDVLAEVGGDALLAGGNLRVDGAVKQGLYAAGGRIAIAAPVQRNVRMAGGSLEIAPQARVSGNVSAAGGDIRVLGPIGGYLLAAGGRVLINGPVAGDVELRAGQIELGPKAAIGGKLRYASRDELKRDPAATVAGGIERSEWRAGWERRHPGRAVGFIWAGGLMLLAAVLAAALPAWYGRVLQTLRQQPGMSALAGLVAIVCIPVAAILLFVTIVGVPLGLLALLAYPALVLVGYVSTGVAGGRMALARWRPAQQASRGWQALAAAAAMLVLSLAASVPWVGGLVALAVLLLGVGSLLLALRPVA
jgi:hypothetical protein